MEHTMKLDPELEEFLRLAGLNLTPQAVEIRGEELHDEFLQFVEDNMPEGYMDEDDIIEREELLYKSWVGHKLAAYDLVLKHIVKYLNGELEE